MATYSPGQSLIVYEGLLKPYEMMVKELKVHAKILLMITIYMK